jgi:hypothetical protein
LGNYHFHTDLQRERIVVADVMEHFRKLGFKVDEDQWTSWEYDFKAGRPGRPILKYEVKEDQESADTRNVAVEFESRGKPSGIAHTEADRFLYVIHTGRGLILSNTKTEVLREACTRADIRTNGGDPGSRTSNYIIYRTLFLTLGGHKKYFWSEETTKLLNKLR